MPHYLDDSRIDMIEETEQQSSTIILEDSVAEDLRLVTGSSGFDDEVKKFQRKPKTFSMIHKLQKDSTDQNKVHKMFSFGGNFNSSLHDKKCKKQTSGKITRRAGNNRLFGMTQPLTIQNSSKELVTTTRDSMDDRVDGGAVAKGTTAVTNATRSFSMPKPLDFSSKNAFNTSEQRRRKRKGTMKRINSMSIERPSTKKLPKHLFISEIKKHQKEEYEVTPT